MELVFCNAFLIQLGVVLVIINLHLASATIGVNYGMQADNLPSPADVISLYKQKNIPQVRLFDPNLDVLEALRGSGLKVSLGVKNEDVPNLANDPNTATQWVTTNVVPYANDVNFGWVTVGNEMVPGPNAGLLPNAINNIQTGLNNAGLGGIKVSTTLSTNVLGVSYPPSAGEFSAESKDAMSQIINVLRATNNPIMINVYPYFALASDPANVPLDYALFDAANPVVDGSYEYSGLFEAMVDSFYAALEKSGWGDATIVVSETGWPSAGNEPYTSAGNAATYNQRLIIKMKEIGGTPRRPSNILDVFIFAMFNENQKPSGVEQNWGISYPNMEPVYPLTFP